MKEKRTNHPLGRRTMAALLAICMLLTMTPAVAAEVETRTLTGFTALSDAVREQTVPHGTAREDLTLPGTLEATALVPAPAEPEEGKPTEQPPAQETEPPAEQTPAPAPAEIIEDAEPPLAHAPTAETVLVTGVTWESAPAYDGALSGTYVFTPVLPAAYVPAAGVSLPVITVTVAQAEPSAADRVMALIDALPTMDQWQAMDEAAARAVMDEILAAKKAYDALTAEEQALIDETRTAKLLELAELAQQLANTMPMAASSGSTLDFATEGSTTPATGDGYEWVKDTKTLTLSNFNYTATDGIGVMLPDGATLVVNGTSRLTTAGFKSISDSGSTLGNYGILCGIFSPGTALTLGALAIEGSGTLEVTCTYTSADKVHYSWGMRAKSITTSSGMVTCTGDAADNSYGVAVEDHIIIDGGSLTGVATATTINLNRGVYTENGSITVNNGTLKGTGATGVSSVGVWGHTLTVNGGSVVGIGGNSNMQSVGVMAVSSITLNSGSLIGTSGTSGTAGDNGMSFGVYTAEALSVTSGTLTATSGTADTSIALMSLKIPTIGADMAIKCNIGDGTGYANEANFALNNVMDVNMVYEGADQTTIATDVKIYKASPTLDFATEDSTTPANGDGYAWDSGTKTLTLTDLNYTATDPVGILLPDGATLVLNGISSVASGDTGAEMFSSSFGIHCLGTFTVSGTGSCVATAGKSSMSVGIMTGAGLILNSGALTGTGTTASQASGGIIASNLTVNSGTLTGIGGVSSMGSVGVSASQSITVNGGSLLAKGGTGRIASNGVETKVLTLGTDVVAKCNIGSNMGYTDSTNFAVKDGMGMVFEGTTQTTIATDVKISKPDIASGTIGVGGTCSWRIDAEGTLILFPTNGISGSLVIVGTDGENQPWRGYNAQITAVKVESGVKAVDNSNYLFYGLSACTKMDLSGLDTTKTIAMAHMFSGCKKLTSITFGNSFDTANVGTMQNMFYGCAALENIDMSKFNTAKVKGMSEMFSGCSSLTALDLSKFNTEEVLDMSNMFYKCSKLNSLDVGSFITAKVTTMQNMFYGCTGLTSLDLSGFDFTKAWGMSMLSDCSIGLKTEYYKKEMSSSKLYLYDKHSKDDFTTGNTDLTGAEYNIVYMPYTMTKSAMTNGSVTTRSRFQATDYQSYFTKTAGFYTSNAPSYDSTKEYAQQGETVTITLTPTSGYVVDTVTVKTADNSEVALSGTGNTRTFTMPADDVTIAVTFALPPSLTVDVANKRIFAEGKEITIISGDYQKTVIQVNGQAATLEGLSGTPTAGYDLSDYAIYGGKNNEALTGSTSITMTGGKVGWIYGGGYGAGGTVSGDRTVTVGGTAVVGATDKGVVIGRGTSWDDNTYVGVKNVTVQSGFTGKVYVVLPTDFDLIANGNFCIANGVTQAMLDSQNIVLTGPGSTVPGVEQRLNGGSFYVEPPKLTVALTDYEPYIFANGYPITIKAVGTEGRANVYFDHYRPQRPVTLNSEAAGNTVDGYELTNCDIYGGCRDKDITGPTHVTLEGGSVHTIYGGNGRSYDQRTTLTGDTNVIIKGGLAESVCGGGRDATSKPHTVTGTCHVTVEGGEIKTLFGGSCAVGGVDVRLTGGTTGTVFAVEANTTVSGNSTISVTGDAVLNEVYAGGGSNSTINGTATLTVGGDVQIGAEVEVNDKLYGAGISLNPNGHDKGVASFAISAPLTGKVYAVLPNKFDASTRPVIATGATAEDLEHFALTCDTVSDLGVKAAYRDGTDIKVKGGVTVTLDYQGADSGNTTATMPVYHGEAYGPLPAPTKSGFGFTGWYDAATGGNLVTKDTVLASSTIDHTLHARWGLTDPTVTLAADKTTADYTGSAAITLTATASHAASDATFTYEWYKGGVKLDGKTAATLELQNVTDSGSYTVKVQAASGGMTSGWVESSAVTATVNKATPTVSTVPTAAAISYGQALNDSTLSGGAASTPGSFAWTDAAVKPACADSGATEYGVTFTPTDTANYNTATCAVKLTVQKATLTVSATANNKTYDGTAAATGTISLTGGVNSEVPTATGSFSFADGEAGNGKTVSVVITLDGNWGDNYALNANTTNTTANIAPRSLGSGTAVPADGITVDAIAPQPYQGGAEVKPLPVVNANGVALTNDTDYTLSYTANTAPGTATVTITGKTNYTGSVTATFTIVLGTAPENSYTKPDGLDKWGKTPIVVTGNAGYQVSTAFDSGFGADVTLSTEGTQTVTIYVKETSTGAVTQAEISYKLDTTAPNLGTVTGNPSGSWVPSAKIEFTPSDATSGVATVTVTPGGKLTPDGDGKYSFTANENGTYTITVTDQAGNTATETVTVSKVDGTKPTVSIAPTPDSGKWYGKTEFTVTSGDGDGGSGVASVTVSGGKFTDADILAAGKFTAEESAAGSYTYTVTVKDAAGNETKATVTIQLDPKIDEFVAKVGTVNADSTYEDLRTVQKWYEDQTKTVQSHITNSTAGKAAQDQLNGWLDGKATEAAQAVVDAINGADTIAKIEQAQKDYNALTDAGKAKVTNKDKLDTLVKDAATAKNVVEQLKNADKPGASYEEKKSALESCEKLTDAQKALADKDAATQKASVTADLSALQAALDKLALVVKPYTPATKALIADAKSAYDALDADCKTAFPKDKKAALDALETMRGHAQSVEDKITALGGSPADADVQAAQAAYNALTADEKLLVDGAKKTALDDAYQAMLGKLDADSKAAAEFATKVAEVKSAPTVEKIKELERDYGKLTPGAKGKVDADSPTKTDYDKLVADKAAAQPVIDKLSAIDLSKLTPENKSAVDAALGDYNGLTPDQKVLVDEATGGKAGILAGANAEIADVTTKIDNILSHDNGTIEGGCPSQPDVGSPTGGDHSYNQHKKSIEEAKLAYEHLSDAARKLVPQALKDKLNREYDALIGYLDYVNMAVTDKSKVEVAGLAENVKLPDESAGAGKTVVTVVMEDTKPAVMPPKPAEKSEALSVDVKLVASIYTDAGDATPATTETVQPKDGQPVLVKLLLPTGYALDTLEIWHVKESGSRSRIYDFWLVTEGGGTYAVFEVSSFSHFVFFAEKVKEPDVPTPPTPDNPGTGTGGGSASFQPEISKSEHGSVTVSPERAKPGDTVTITAKPDQGYAVDTVIVKDSGGKTVAVTPGKDGTYTFTQPSGKVTVTVTFKPMEQKPTELPFTDVAQSDWFRDSVAYVYGQGLMNGTSGTTFSPYLSTDRGMIVTILWRMEGSPTATKTANFTDVAPGRYYSEAVAWGAEQGIILGYDDRRYAPGDPITREQLASILWRYARYKKWDVSVGENTNILSYLDFPQISEYAIPALQWAAGAQIMSGKSDGILDPKGNATRAETATMLERFLTDKR